MKICVSGIYVNPQAYTLKNKKQNKSKIIVCLCSANMLTKKRGGHPVYGMVVSIALPEPEE